MSIVHKLRTALDESHKNDAQALVNTFANKVAEFIRLNAPKDLYIEGDSFERMLMATDDVITDSYLNAIEERQKELDEQPALHPQREWGTYRVINGRAW